MFITYTLSHAKNSAAVAAFAAAAAGGGASHPRAMLARLRAGEQVPDFGLGLLGLVLKSWQDAMSNAPSRLLPPTYAVRYTWDAEDLGDAPAVLSFRTARGNCVELKGTHGNPRSLLLQFDAASETLMSRLKAAAAEAPSGWFCCSEEGSRYNVAEFYGGPNLSDPEAVMAAFLSKKE